LPKGDHPIFSGQHSPFLVLALFSKVLAKPQPDWPPNTVVTGFPFFDKKTDEGLPGEIRKFVDSGPPPVVFTLGSSAVWTAGDFFVESVNAIEQLGMRAILLVGDKSKLSPGELPPNVAAFDYAPYSELLPHTALTVHQGGIGTTAQALRSGRPMLVVPFSHDQPDNARRVKELGVAVVVPRAKYRADRIVKELRELLANPAYQTNAEAVADVIRTETPEVTACDEIEKTFFS
jgi:UDP:flavonoid glycosyltransferase YjiC (YdhE family)